MCNKKRKRSAWRVLALACAAGTLFGSSCGSDGFQAVVAGFGAAAQELDRQDRRNNPSFGDWLLNELGNF